MARVATDVYARALFELGEEKGKLSMIANDLYFMHAEMNRNPELMKLLKSPLIPNPKKKEQMEKLFGKEVEPESLHFLFTLIDKHRVDQFESMYRAFRSMFLKKNHFIEAVAITREPLTPKKREELELALSKAIGRDAIVENRVDPHIIGGVVLEMEGRVIDDSIRGRLETLHHDLRTAKGVNR